MITYPVLIVMLVYLRFVSKRGPWNHVQHLGSARWYHTPHRVYTVDIKSYLRGTGSDLNINWFIWYAYSALIHYLNLCNGEISLKILFTKNALTGHISILLLGKLGKKRQLSYCHIDILREHATRHDIVTTLVERHWERSLQYMAIWRMKLILLRKVFWLFVPSHFLIINQDVI